MVWLSEANRVIADTEVLTVEERQCAATFLWWIGVHFMPVFMNNKATQKELKYTLVDALTLGEGYEDYREGISNIGIAFLRIKGGRSSETVREFMQPFSLFREIIEILWNYDVAKKLNRDAA
jgi:hypothetical protein